MIEREIAESADAWVCPPFPFPLRGSPRSTWSSLGRLTWSLPESAGERELLVYLARAVPEYDVKAPRRVLERCHTGTPIPCRCPGGAQGQYCPSHPFPRTAGDGGGHRKGRPVPQRRHGYRRQGLIPQPRFSYRQRRTAMPSINLLDPSLGIQTIMESPGGNARAASPRRGPSPPMSCARPGLRNCIPRAMRTTSWSRRSARMRATATSSARRCFPATSRDAWKP